VNTDPLAQWAGQRIWIVGASSGIGAALTRELLPTGARLALSARREAPLRELLPGASAGLEPTPHLILPLDITQLEQVRQAHQTIQERWGQIDRVIWVAGNYIPMRADAIDPQTAASLIHTNLTSIYGALSVVLPNMLARGSGAIALVASVAGYSGLPKALVYGPTKAALINLAETLYLDLKPRGLRIQIINPGFVSTPLTAQNDFKMPALISPDEAAREIRKGLEHGGFEIHFPKRFSRFLKLLRLLPYWLYLPLAGLTGKN
jgi:short-subunit dehydrogenase